MVDLKSAKAQFSKLGFGAFAILLIGAALQILMALLRPQGLKHSWGMWFYTFAPLYLVAVPVGVLLIRRAPAKPLEKRSLSAKQYLVIFLISVFMMFIGNYAGMAVSTIIRRILGITAGNPIIAFASDNSILPKILFMVILAPLLEEYIFRKLLIDRMHMYGEKLAVITSALMFALFHGNLGQLFYAFTLGLVFGYVYLKTGKLRYSISLHMIINLFGSIIGPTFLEHIDFNGIMEDFTVVQSNLPWILGFSLYSMALFAMGMIGLILFCIHVKDITFAAAEQELPRESRWKTVFLNLGMILMTAACLVMIITSFS